MNASLVEVVVLALAAWYSAFVIVNEDGLFGVLRGLRSIAPGRTPFTCIVCTSLWTALACYALLGTGFAPVVYVLAGAGGALVVQRFIGW